MVLTHDKPWFALLVAVALLFPAHVSLAADIHALDPPFPAAKRAAIEAAVNKSFGEARAPGVVVGIWIPGEGSYVTAKGFADIKTRQPMRTADHFRIGSITKTIFKALTAVVTPNNVPQ